MKKICIHWTAGPYQRTVTDERNYHFTVAENGQVQAGKFPPEANIPPLKNGKYAAHCGGGNSFCIGVAMCGMLGFQGKAAVGKAPLTLRQAEACWHWVACLCKKYGIPILTQTVFTHYEFGQLNPASSSAGKVDITCLPFLPELEKYEIGDYIRRKVSWYLARLKD